MMAPIFKIGSKTTLCILMAAFFFYGAAAQQPRPRYWDAIQAFKKQDSILFPPKDRILLMGSSSFTRWKNVQEYFPGFPLLNRGFGGAKLDDLIRYVPDIVDPYAPKQVLIYCGNDISDLRLTATDISAQFVALFNAIRLKNKKAQITFISIRPEPVDVGRPHRIQKKKEVNRLIRAFLDQQKASSFINVYDAMLEEDGSMMDIYWPDGHMNEKGYRIWQQQIAPHLIP